MKYTLLYLLALLLPLSGRAAETKLPPRLTIELRDGSRVVGASVAEKWEFRSALLGKLKIPINNLRLVDCTSTNGAKLTTATGDTLTVSLAVTTVAVNTSFGKVDLAVNSIRKIRISAATSSAAAREGLVLFWSGTPDGQNNLGTDLDTAKTLRETGVVKVANNPALVSMQQTRQITYEAWIKPNSVPREFPILLAKGGNHPNGAYGGYEFYLNWNNDHDLSFASGASNYGTYNANGRWINRHLGEWIHVAFTLDDSLKIGKFFVNGEPTDDTRSVGSNGDVNFDLPNDLYIGSPDPAAHPNRVRFDGDMRNVMLFNRTLTANEIHDDYAVGHPD